MSFPARRSSAQPVTPLELFFDLVYVFAIGQLSHHLLDHLTWRGVVQTLVLLLAVFTVWVHTSFETTFFDITRRATQLSVLAAMGLGLFMNAGISTAFAAGGLLFALPLVVIQVGRGLITSRLAPNETLHVHYRRMFVWLVASAPFWVTGGVADEDLRLWWWLAAVGIDVVGTLLAHPLPGSRYSSVGAPFDGAHMNERLRLFLIIALGEAILTTGTAIAITPTDPWVLVAGVAAFVVIAALWALYFGGAEQLVEQHLARTCDPTWAARMAADGQYVVFAGLVAVAVGCELVVEHPLEPGTLILGVLLFGGALSYAAAQTWYLHITTRHHTTGRWLACTALAAGIPFTAALPALGSLLALAVALTVFVAYTVHARTATAIQKT